MVATGNMKNQDPRVPEQGPMIKANVTIPD